MTIVEMRVHMDCPGCENKIKKALQKLNGIDDIDIDMQMQKVTVTGWADRKRVLKTVRKTGRKAEFWPFPYNPEYHDFTRYYYQQNHHQQYSHSYIPEATSSYYYSQPQPLRPTTIGFMATTATTTATFNSRLIPQFSTRRPVPCSVMTISMLAP